MIMDKLTMQAYYFFASLVDSGMDYCDAQCKTSVKYPSVDFSEVEDLYYSTLIVEADEWSI